MRKKELEKGKLMSAATFVAEAGKLANAMVQREMRGPGDLDNAMRRVEAKFGVPYQSLWNLRYRPPKEIAAHVYAGILNAYDEQCARQARLYQHEAAIAKAKGGVSAAFARAADRVAGEEN